MILRKPYAFLIKYFKIINFIIFLFVVFLLNRVLNLYSFAKDYLLTGIYNETFNAIGHFINGYVYIVLFLTTVISSFLLYLFIKKQKPIVTYIYVIVLSVLTFVLFVYVHNYFTYNAINGFNEQIARAFRDLILIDSFFYYPILIVLIIRFLGIDLKNFGFAQDQEFMEINEADREEIEVSVNFNKEKYIRLFFNKLRYTKYFVLEHLVPILLIGGFVLLIGIYNGYHYIFVENKIYKQGEAFTANYYKIKINHTYLTNKDYAGNVVASKNRTFVIADINIQNLTVDRNFDITKLFLYIDTNYYVPTVRYNNSFKDMGTTFDKYRTIKRGENKRYILIYEVDKPKKNSNLILKYQDLVSKNNKQIRVRMKVLDISEFKEKEKSSLEQSIKVPINEGTAYEFTLSNFEITNEKNYTYESCYLYSCPVYEKKLVADKNKTLVFFRVNSNISNSDFIAFLKKHGKIQYVVDGKTYTEKISLKVDKYQGNYAYIEASDMIQRASKIQLIFTVRSYQYFYILKGE